MKSNKYLLVAVAFVLFIASFAFGCTPARRPILDNRTPNTTQNNNLSTPGRLPGETTNPNLNTRNNTVTDNNLTTTRDTNMNQDLERRIADQVTNIAGVNAAEVLVNGNTAYVGIDAGRTVEDEATNRLKDQVIDKVKAVDPRITRVYVSADVDVMQRLRNYGTDIRGGRPISGFINEIEEMFRRPMPTTR